MYEYENGMVMSPSGKYAGGFYATLDEDGSLFIMPSSPRSRRTGNTNSACRCRLFKIRIPNAITDEWNHRFQHRRRPGTASSISQGYWGQACRRRTRMSAHPSVASTSHEDGNFGSVMPKIMTRLSALKWVDGEAQGAEDALPRSGGQKVHQRRF